MNEIRTFSCQRDEETFNQAQAHQETIMGIFQLSSAVSSVAIRYVKKFGVSLWDVRLHLGRKAAIAAALLSLSCLEVRAGTATFAFPNNATTGVTFSSSGTYVLRVAVSDGVLISTGSVTITVNPSVAVNPTLTINPSSVIGGNSDTITVSEATGTVGIAALQFDMTLPPGVSTPTVVAGPATIAAGKTVASAMVGGNFRVLVSGLNQTTLGSDGLALITMTIPANAVSGPLPLTLINVSAADANANNVPVNIINGIILVTANKPPVVTMSVAQTITLPVNTVNVGVTATDDGAPNPPGVLTYTWSYP